MDLTASSIALPASHATLRERLNTRWHERALQVFMLVVLGHWSEHLAQAFQIYVLKWPVPQSRGVLGLWYPWLIKSEVLHYSYAVVMLFGIWLLRPGFTGLSRTWWDVPRIIEQLWVPRVEIPLIYNTLVFIPMVIAMYYHMFPSQGEAEHTHCTCA